MEALAVVILLITVSILISVVGYNYRNIKKLVNMIELISETLDKIVGRLDKLERKQ